ncbi:SDR family oxidoreductase [Streptomyces sp. NPDC037389]|uniref:SDR family oxidoreductase n=1 Tax=Streptomyces sp. NPDC037389 TaxID=3155369 RepID=UPI0034060947
MSGLSGKTALVTGASRGIGRAVAERLAADGALVAVHYGSNEAAAKETVTAIEAAGGRAFPLGAVLGEPGDAEALWAAFDERIGEFSDRPGLDILVNNAGILVEGGIADVDEEGYDRVFAVNAKAPFFIIKHGLERLRDGGRIINVSSGVTRVAYPPMTAYAMAKGALNTLTLTLAQALGSRNITVNAVTPGIIETDLAPYLADPETRKVIAGFSVFDRVGQTGDVSGIVGFLASADAGWITGQIVDATGGCGIGI